MFNKLPSLEAATWRKMIVSLYQLKQTRLQFKKPREWRWKGISKIRLNLCQNLINIFNKNGWPKMFVSLHILHREINLNIRIRSLKILFAKIQFWVWWQYFCFYKTLPRSQQLFLFHLKLLLIGIGLEFAKFILFCTKWCYPSKQLSWKCIWNIIFK